MRNPTDYQLAVRTTGSPPAPEGVTAVTLRPTRDPDGDTGAGAVAAALGGLRASGLTAADLRSRVLFLAPEGTAAGLVAYAALCGFSGRRLDVWADGTVLEADPIDRAGAAVPDPGPPPRFLTWAQVGGPVAEGIPTVAIPGLDRLAGGGRGGDGPGGGPVADPQVVSVIRYAARLRMVPPGSARAAFTLFLLVAAMRRGAADRFPFLSTGREPVPHGRDAPGQGIDLERLRQEAVRYRRGQRRARRAGAEIVPPVPLPPHDARAAGADRADVREVLRRLGARPGADGLWFCPRPGAHPEGRPTLRLYGDGRARCPRCDTERVGPLRLVVEVLGVTPDEAATFILDSDRVIDPPAR